MSALTVLFKGYAGNGNEEANENEAMGLIVGRRYFVIDTHECECCKALPVVQNDRGEPQSLVHGEYEE